MSQTQLKKRNAPRRCKSLRKTIHPCKPCKKESDEDSEYAISEVPDLAKRKLPSLSNCKLKDQRLPEKLLWGHQGMALRPRNAVFVKL